MQEDLQALAADKHYNFSVLQEKTILVTGATGLIGQHIIRFLAELNEANDLNIKILALVRNAEKGATKFADLLENNAICLLLSDVTKPLNYDQKIDYIIHAAGPTNSKYFVKNPVETIDTIYTGTKNMLDLAQEKECDGFIFLSSLEVYGQSVEKKTLSENDYGYIDILDVRSSYSEGKRQAECLCKSYFEEYNVPIKIARLSQTFGPGVEYNDQRVFAEFCRCAIEKKNIVLHTSGQTTRTYCYTKDAISAILTILLKGAPGEAYNVANKDTSISIKEMAKLICDIFPESNINVEIEIPENLKNYGYNPETMTRLDSSKLEKLGWAATTNIKEMLENTKKDMEERIEEPNTKSV